MHCHHNGAPYSCQPRSVCATDNLAYNKMMWGPSPHPHPDAPACVPCGYGGDASELGFPMPQGCPCRPAALCAADTARNTFPNVSAHCGIPRQRGPVLRASFGHT